MGELLQRGAPFTADEFMHVCVWVFEWELATGRGGVR
jgi:hypothetical protein